MKKIIFIAFVFAALGMSAQKHEVKVDLLDILAFKTLDVAYEYQLNAESSIGVSTFVNFDADNNVYDEDFQLTPYFRQFFKTTKSFDFFGELFGTLNFGENEDEDKNYTDFGLGIGGGARHISEYGYVFEFNIGVARNLFNTDLSNEVVPRFGISVGKQF